MPKYRVYEIKTVVDKFEVEFALDRHDAIRIVAEGKLESKATKTVEVKYDTERLDLPSS